MTITVPDTEGAAYALLEALRWPQEGAPTECPHCQTPDDQVLLVPRNGRSRATRTGSISERRVWRCGACRKQFSVLTGTYLERTKVPLCAWIAFVLGACEVWPRQIPIRTIAARYGVNPTSARRMRLRLADALAAAERERANRRQGAA